MSANVEETEMTTQTDAANSGQIFALFIIAVAAAEVGVGLAIVLNMFRNRASIDVEDVDLMRW